VILTHSHIFGFGKLQDLGIDFGDRINLIFASNEGGKSTLQRCLLGLLYGQLRSDLKMQRRLDPWVDHYKPWHGSEYGGILWCRLADGRDLEIRRSFGKDETRIEIRTSTGEEVTRQYEQQRNGEVLFARFHLGLPKELFESVGVIRETRTAEIHSHETIRDRIANLAQSGDEELSIRQSLATIQELLDSIGSERAPTKPYKQAQDLLQELHGERQALEDRRTQFQGWVEERNRLKIEVSELEHALARAQMALLSARRRDVESRVRSLEEIENDISHLKTEIDLLGAREDFPSDRLEELNQLVGARDSIARHLSEIRTEKGNALAELSRAELERQKLGAYASLASSSEAEKVTEWFVSYLNLSLQKDGMLKTVGRLRDESATLEKKLSGFAPALIDPKTDWQRMAREAAEDEQLAAQNCATLAEKIAGEKATLATASERALRRRTYAGLSIALVVLALILRYFTDFFPGIPHLAALGFGSGLAALAAVLLIAATKSARTGRISKGIIQSLELEQKKSREEGGKKRKNLHEIVVDSGFRIIDDFLAAAKQSEQNRQRLADLDARLLEVEHQRERLQSQSDEIYQLLKESLAKVGLSCSPGSMKFQIDSLRANLRRFRELDAAYSSCIQRADALKLQDQELTGTYESKCSTIQALLDQAQTSSPESFREECDRKRKHIELNEKMGSRSREFQRLAGDLTLAQWKERYQELMAQPGIAVNTQELSVRESGPNAPLLPYLPTIAEAEEEERRIASRLAYAREEYARALERTNQAFQNYRTSAEIEEDLAEAEKRFRALGKNRVALGFALETLESLSRQQQEVLAPQLNSAVEQRFLRLCGGRYEEVKIDPDFQIWVRESTTAELRLAEHLSRGTQDQLYFAMRFGILDLVAHEDEPCPCLLDEPFAAYDRPRLHEAFEVLVKEAERRQLILFTCREDVLDLARQKDATIILL
jgi:uncharacterized protein YhaN